MPPSHRRPLPAPPSRRPIRIRAEWVAAVLALFAIGWLVTEGDWDFYKSYGLLEGFYDAQAESLLAGHVDVPAEAIAAEAFTHDGKHYGYFGPTPALFRIPLVLLFPGSNGHWSRWSMFAGSALALWALLLLLKTMEDAIPPLANAPNWRWLKPVLVVTAGVGSTLFFIVAETKVYEESIEWGAALALASAVCLLRFFVAGGGRWLPAACAFGFLAFFARVSSGAGPIFALALLDLALLMPTDRLRAWLGIAELRASRRAVALLTATVVVTAVLWGALNYVKFGRVFTSQPLELTRGGTPERMARIKGSLSSIANLPMTASLYLSPANIKLSPIFPWVSLIHIEREQLVARFPAAHIDVCEFFASLPDSMPALFFAALAGTVLAARRARYRILRLPLLSGAAGCGVVFLWGWITHRYLHDFFPWLVIGSAIAVAGIALVQRARWRRVLATAFVVTAIGSVWENFAFGLTQQRVWAVPMDPEKQIAYVDAQEAITTVGFGAFVSTVTRWTEYHSAAATQSAEHLGLYESEFAPWRIVRPAAPPPYAANYVFEVPREGLYELAIRYASAEPRPVLVSIDGVAVGMACTVPTGGDTEAEQRWIPAGKIRLRRGAVAIGLSSNATFPSLSFLRLTHAD
jgi:hypothetical protein